MGSRYTPHAMAMAMAMGHVEAAMAVVVLGENRQGISESRRAHEDREHENAET